MILLYQVLKDHFFFIFKGAFQENYLGRTCKGLHTIKIWKKYLVKKQVDVFNI